MRVEFHRVEIPRDDKELLEFLGKDEWPFHGQRLPTSDDIAAMDFSSPDVASFWIAVHRNTVGLLRLLDLGDLGKGAPQFDLRIASRHRGRGFGTQAARWIVDHLFTSYPQLHRIEANTRHDNAAMQRVLSDTGFTHEGQLRESWRGDEGKWFDTMTYGILRTEWKSTIHRYNFTGEVEGGRSSVQLTPLGCGRDADPRRTSDNATDGWVGAGKGRLKGPAPMRSVKSRHHLM